VPIKPLLVLLAPLAMLALTGCGKEAAQPPRPALTQQVDYGAGAYRYGCGRCHASGRSSVELTAEQLTAKYTTADQLYEFVRRSMPLDEPGSLPDGDYWAIVAYVLDNTGLLSLPRESELGPRTARSILISPRPAVSVERVTTASGPE
jgi:cytochrome c551/c552